MPMLEGFVETPADAEPEVEALEGRVARIVSWIRQHQDAINRLDNFNIEIHARDDGYLSFKVSSLFRAD